MNFIYNFITSFAGISYLAIWVLVLVSTLSKDQKLIHISKYFVYLFAFVFLGLRDQHSGTDTNTYVEFFLTGVSVGEVEIAFDYFTRFLRHLGGWQFFLFFNVLFQIVCLSMICKLFHISRVPIFLLGYLSIMPGFDMLTNGLRQGLASVVGMLLYSLCFYRRYLPKVFVILSVFFHKSMLPYLSLPILARISKPKTNYFFSLFCFISFCLLIIFWHIFPNVIDVTKATLFLSFTVVGTSVVVGDKLNIYMTSDQDILSGVMKYYFLFIVVLIQLIYIFGIKNHYLSRNIATLRLGSFFMLLSVIYAFSWISPFSYRFMYIAFLPGLFLTFVLFEHLNFQRWYVISMFFFLFSAVLVYGSNTFSRFNLSF